MRFLIYDTADISQFWDLLSKFPDIPRLKSEVYYFNGTSYSDAALSIKIESDGRRSVFVFLQWASRVRILEKEERGGLKLTGNDVQK